MLFSFIGSSPVLAIKRRYRPAGGLDARVGRVMNPGTFPGVASNQSTNQSRGNNKSAAGKSTRPAQRGGDGVIGRGVDNGESSAGLRAKEETRIETRRAPKDGVKFGSKKAPNNQGVRGQGETKKDPEHGAEEGH